MRTSFLKMILLGVFVGCWSNAADATARLPKFEETQDGVIDGSQQIDDFAKFNIDIVQITITRSAEFLASVFKSGVGPSSTSTVLLLYRLGEFNSKSFNDNLLVPILADAFISSRGDGPFPEGQYEVVVVANISGDKGPYSIGLIGAVFGIGPTLEQRLDALRSTIAALSRLATQGAANNARRGAQNSFATRDQLRFHTFDQGGDESYVLSTRNGKLVHNVYSWLEVSGYIADGTNARKFSGVGLQGGVDVAVSENFLLGLSIGYNDLHGRTPLASTEGDFLFLQPYLGYRRGGWSAELSLTAGEADYTQTSAGGVGTADSEVYALNLSVARDYALTDTVTLTPIAALHYGEETITGKTGTLAAAGRTTVDL